jgi:hypothetical protein
MKVLHGTKAIELADEMVANGAWIAQKHVHEFKKQVRLLQHPKDIKKPG